MYDELVKRLRELYPEEFGNAWDFAFACQQAMHEAADAIEELQGTQMSVAKWIPVSERLPEDGVYVLGRYKNDEMAVVSVFDHDEDFTFWRAQTDEGWEADCDTEPTHWMPLPQPPDHIGDANEMVEQ